MPSSKGMTRYGTMELYKHAIVKNDERMLKEIYQFALQNNLPAYTLFNAALTSLKAETTRELNKNIKTMADLRVAIHEAAKEKNIQNLKRLRNRLKRMGKETADRRAGIRAYTMALVKLKKYQEEK